MARPICVRGRRSLAPRGGAKSRGRKVVSREDRVVRRKLLGNLRGLVTSNLTKLRYARALKRFFEFERVNEANYSTCEVALDLGVCEYVQCLWQDGEPRYWGEDVISAFSKRVPQLKGCFPGAWQLISAWQKHELPQRCTPFSLDVLKAMCGLAISWGETSMALCLSVAFHGILRTAEMYSMAVGHFTFHPSLCSCVLALPFTKSGTRFNTVESVILDDAHLVSRLHTCFRNLPAETLVFTAGSRAFRTLFDDLVSALHLPHNLMYKPYSVRRGAATSFFRATASLSRTAVRGRWSNEKTCRIYVNESMCELADIKFSPKCRNLVQHFACGADRFFR